MRQPLSRGTTRRPRLPVAAACFSLALAGGAQSADLKPLRVTVGSPTAGAIGLAPPAPAPSADQQAGVGLLQSLQLFLDWIFTGHAEAAPLAYAPPGVVGTAPTEIVPYPGPLAPGTVIINLDRLRVYRVLGGGWAELYQEASESAVLARIGMAR